MTEENREEKRNLAQDGTEGNDVSQNVEEVNRNRFLARLKCTPAKVLFASGFIFVTTLLIALLYLIFL